MNRGGAETQRVMEYRLLKGFRFLRASATLR